MTDPQDHPAYRLREIPDPPDTLSAGGRKEWTTLAKQIYELRTARPADVRLLEVLCELLSDISVLQETIRADGLTIEAGSGGRKGHPGLASLEKARRHAQNLLDQFGLTPGTITLQAPEYQEYRHKQRYGD